MTIKPQTSMNSKRVSKVPQTTSVSAYDASMGKSRAAHTGRGKLISTVWQQPSTGIKCGVLAEYW